MNKTNASSYLRLCDRCCDGSGTSKEMVKTGGCTCDICGWVCSCCGGEDGRQFVNNIPVRIIPEEGWEFLERRNRQSLAPLDWLRVFMIGRE